MNGVRRLMRAIEPRPLRRSIGLRVLAGFGLTAALAVAVATISLVYNTDAGRNLARVSERDREVSAALRDLEVTVEQGSGAVQNYLLSGDDRDLVAVDSAILRFEQTLVRLQQILPPDRAGPAIEDLANGGQMLADLAMDEIALYRQGWIDTANSLWRTDGVQVKADLLAAVQRQVQEHNADIDREVAASRGHLRFAFGLSLGLVTLAAVLALAIGIAISRAVTRPVRGLVRVASAVRGGDYSVRAPLEGDDELTTLATTMNAMVESLAVSRSQLESALADTERSEERYRLLTENANDIIFTLDRQNCYSFINNAVRRILGYEPADLIGRKAVDTFTPETRELMARNRAWATREPRVFTADIELLGKNGRVVPLEVRSSVMRVNGVAVGIQGIARDMTERHRIEEELRRLHAQDRRRVDQLVTVNEMGRKIAALQPVDTLLPHLVRMLGATFGYQQVRILLEASGGELTTAAAWYLGSSQLPAAEMPVSQLVLRALKGDAGFVAGSGRPEDDAATRYTEVAVPVRTKSGVLGVLDIRDSADGGLDESDIFTLQILADQIAVAIENARLFEAGQQLAVSEERNRLARELHDSVTQELFSMTMIAGALPALMERKPEVAVERVERLHELSRAALAEMRALLFALRPAALAEEGLVAALTKHVAAFESREGITVHLDIDGEGRLPQRCEEALYRIFQEALNNVVKHARAKTVWVQLAIDDDETTLSIRDDGVGMDLEARSPVPTMGLSNMRERVGEIGGSFSIDSVPGVGTTVKVMAPVGREQIAGATPGV